MPPKDAEVLSHQEVGKGHGRVETRTASVCHDVGWRRERHGWPGLAAVGKVAATRWTKHGGETAETRHYLLSAALSAADFGRAVRSHWAIEKLAALGAGRDPERGRAAQPHGPRPATWRCCTGWR